MEGKMAVFARERSDSAGTVPDDVWLQRVGGFTAVPALLRELGAEPDSLMAAAGLAPDALQSPDGRVPLARLGRLLHDAAESVGAPHFGLLAGRAWHLADLGLLGEALRCSPTVGVALRTLTDHQHHHSDGGVAFLWRHAGVADLGYAIYRGGNVGSDQFYDAVMAFATNLMHELCGPGWNPTEVFLPHTAPADTRHHRNLFRVLPHFDAEYCALRFADAWLDAPVEGGDVGRWHDALARMATATHLSVVQAVYRALRVKLLTGNCSGDSVAAALSMHRRTLNRRLKDEGTTFQRCLDQVRFEVACQLLATSHVPLDDIAATLGYASVSPFMRTFRRWSGTTPAQWRRRAVGGSLARPDEAAEAASLARASGD
jgi:AraC-like DNA-binding protein